jgi:iron uptake system component EfeO
MTRRVKREQPFNGRLAAGATGLLIAAVVAGCGGSTATAVPPTPTGTAAAFPTSTVAATGGATAAAPSQATPSQATPSQPAPSQAAAASGGILTVTVTLTNASCVPDQGSVAAGPVTFHVVNEGGDRVSEVELLQGDTIVGEKENLAPGFSGDFSVDLAAGDYSIACPGADAPSTAFTVVAAVAQASAGPADALLAQATAAYAEYVREQVASLVTSTKAFTDAVLANDLTSAKALYSAPRVYYERIEPVAESFGDLDPAIDGREDDAATPADFTGFHRLEKAIWQEGSLAGMAPIAQKLNDDVNHLQTLVATETYQPAQLANGATELLDEIAHSKITGEEERYSHIDLLDFQGNLDGAQEAFTELRPALGVLDSTLAATLDQRFAAVQAALATYRDGDGFVSYTQLTDTDTRALAQAVDALAQPLSQVAAVILAS